MDSYVYLITALLPLVAVMLVLQKNPYHALVIRGILGAIAALVYTVLGAADVALTEALVGTLLAIMLYAVAVRSSMVLRLGVPKAVLDSDGKTPQTNDFQQILNHLQTIFDKHHMRVELVPYLELEDLHQALAEKEVHGICVPHCPPNTTTTEPAPPVAYHATIRLRRLYDIIQSELLSPGIRLTYFNSANSNFNSADSKEVHS